MHAASVHPEPGSNSLKNLYQTPGLLPLRSIRFSELMFYLSFFYFLSNKLLCFNEIPSHVLFVFEIPVVQFSMTDAASLSLSDLSILPHLFPFVNPFFELFSSFLEFFKFQALVSALPQASFLEWGSSIISFASPFVKGFFRFLACFFIFVEYSYSLLLFRFFFCNFAKSADHQAKRTSFIRFDHWLFLVFYV